MTFRTINHGGAANDRGVNVQIVGPSTLRYEVGNKVTIVEIGRDPIDRTIRVYASKPLAWTGVGDPLPLTDEERSAMERDLREALALLEGDFRVV